MFEGDIKDVSELQNKIFIKNNKHNNNNNKNLVC